MNSMLMDMLAARANGNTNPALADMLARMRSSSGDGSNPISPDMLNQLANSGNPMLSMFAKQMAEAKARPVVIDVEAEEVTNDSDDLAAQNHEAAMADLRSHVQNMFAELNLLRERIDTLATALGACCLCWGQDAHCRVCRGRGGPGFSVPEQTLFEEFVLPAIRTLRAQTARRRPVSSALQSQTQLNHDRTKLATS